ncbi:TnpV protein [Roseburia intestinalis]
MREITYSQNGEYQIPDISLEETRGTIGKYGLMRKEYLRNHKVARFNILTLQNRLDSHLMEIDSQARQRVDNLMSELLEKNPAPDKMADGMVWTRHMNQIKAQAEELVIQEIIYN